MVDIVAALIFFALKFYVVYSNYAVLILIACCALEYVFLSILYKMTTGSSETLVTNNRGEFKENLVDFAKVMVSSIAIIVYMKLDITALKT